MLEAVEPSGVPIRKIPDELRRAVIHAIEEIPHFADHDIPSAPGHGGGKKSGQQLIFLIIDHNTQDQQQVADPEAGPDQDGSGGGDSVVFVAPGQPAGTPLVGDSGELCKAVDSLVFCDRNQNGLWDGNGGGDLATNFAPGAGEGSFLFADTTGNGVKELVKYVPDLSGADAFLIDANENNVWDGSGGGDAVHFVAPGAAELIQLAGIAVKMGATKEDFDRTVAVHPTMAEEIVTMARPVRTA